MPSASCRNSDQGCSSTVLVEAPPPLPSKAINYKECATASGARLPVWQTARRRPLPLLLAAGGLLVGYCGFERISTRANADKIEFSTNYGGGFLAVGKTESQPGFIVLSALDQEQVDVSAQQSRSMTTGTHTMIEIRTPRERWLTRLRKPQVIIVAADGTISARSVGWSIADFAAIEVALDCEHPTPSGRHRCGAPFANLQEIVLAGRLQAPDAARGFLKQFGDN